jgi:hypothetical protein
MPSIVPIEKLLSSNYRGIRVHCGIIHLYLRPEYFHLPAVHLLWNGDAFAVSFNRASTALHWCVHRECNTYNNGQYNSLNISSERPCATSIYFLHSAMHFVRDLDPSTKVGPASWCLVPKLIVVHVDLIHFTRTALDVVVRDSDRIGCVGVMGLSRCLRAAEL